ncbi:MAG: M50 family metallopeptidase [Anaerolineales bacterium]
MLDFLIFILILSVLIIGHELGHFFAARWGGVKIDEFGLGFPPRLLTLFKAGGTRFTLNLLPFGGFVRPRGENDPSVKGGLAAASKRIRAIVLLAGPIANILLGFLAFSMAYKIAAPDPSRVMITDIAANSPASEAGLAAGDIILQVEDVQIDGFQALQEIVGENLGEPTELTIARDGETLQLELVPRPDPPPNEGAIGILLGNPTRPVSIGKALTLGWDSTRIQFTEILRLPGRLIGGDVAPEEARVTGFKGIYDMVAWAGEVDRSAERPFLTLNLIGVISIGLAVANLLPIPALDGGRLLFVAIELVLGHRIDPEKEGIAHLIGFAFLLLLMVYINFQDFINPISLPR